MWYYNSEVVVRVLLRLQDSYRVCVCHVVVRVLHPLVPHLIGGCYPRVVVKVADVAVHSGALQFYFILFLFSNKVADVAAHSGALYKIK